MKRIDRGTKIRFKSGDEFEILKVYNSKTVDMKGLESIYKTMPDFFPVYYEVEIKNYEII